MLHGDNRGQSLVRNTIIIESMGERVGDIVHHHCLALFMMHTLHNMPLYIECSTVSMNVDVM